MTLEADVKTLQEDVARLQPEIPRFGSEDAAQLTDELREEFGGRTSLSTEFLHNAPLAQLSTSGRDGATAWISDGRKSGEGAEAGTGMLAYFDSASSTWLSFRDDAPVVT